MDYQLKPIGKTCAATGEELSPGTECYSVLLEENGRNTRQDFSAAGWSGPPENAVGYWRTSVPEPNDVKPKPLDSESLLQSFEQLSEDANPAQEKLRFVTALLLVQKRRLKLDGSRRDGDIEFLQLVGSHGEGPYEVREFDLSADERQELQQAVDAFLAAA
jgi:hypothetical protein